MEGVQILSEAGADLQLVQHATVARPQTGSLWMRGISARVDVNVEDRSGTTLLHSLVRAWIRGGGNNQTTLPWAVTRLLEQKEVDALKPSKETGRMVLHEIASDDEPVKQPAADLAATLIRRGADPLVRNDEGRSATDVALAKGHLQLAAMLLEAADHKDACPK